MHKNLYFIGEVNNDNIKTLIEQLVTASDDSKTKEIILYLNSTGGYFYPALAIYDLIKNLEKPVTVITLGTCQSSAVLILQAAKRRVSLPNTVFMIHHLSHSVENIPNKNYEQISKEFSRNNQTFIDLISHRGSKKCQEIIAKIVTDMYLDADRMLEYNLLDSING